MRYALLSAALLVCLSLPVEAAQCRHQSDQSGNTLSINDEEQTVTLYTAGPPETCSLLRSVSDMISRMDCPSGETMIAFLNDYEGPTVFLVRGETFRWTCE